MSFLIELFGMFVAVRYFPIIVILVLVGMFIFMKIIDWSVPDYMVQDLESPVNTTNVKITTTTKVITEKPKAVKTKTKKVVKKSKPINSYKYKMDRFEEEAFWMNVFDDDEF